MRFCVGQAAPGGRTSILYLIKRKGGSREHSLSPCRLKSKIRKRIAKSSFCHGGFWKSELDSNSYYIVNQYRYTVLDQI